jgi:hypothetical protein
MKPNLRGVVGALFMTVVFSPASGLSQGRSQASIRVDGAQTPDLGPFGREETSSDHADIQWAVIDTEVRRLDKLVTLTTQQQAKASRIFAVQNGGYLWVGTVDGQIDRAGPQLRAILTPAQLSVFDRYFPDGGDTAREARSISNRISKWVGLSDDQSERVNAIILKEGIDLNALYPDADPRVAVAIRQTATDQIRGMLTPEQQKRYDENPTGIASIEEMRFVENLLRTSDKIASRYGAIKALALRRAHSFDFDAAGHPLKGDFMFNVEGSRKSEYIFIHWDRNSETAPIEIIKVEAATGGEVAI